MQIPNQKPAFENGYSDETTGTRDLIGKFERSAAVYLESSPASFPDDGSQPISSLSLSLCDHPRTAREEHLNTAANMNSLSLVIIIGEPRRAGRRLL